MSATLRSASPMTIDEAWWCPDFGVRLPAKQIVLHYGDAPCAGGFEIRAGCSGAIGTRPDGPGEGASP